MQTPRQMAGRLALLLATALIAVACGGGASYSSNKSMATMADDRSYAAIESDSNGDADYASYDDGAASEAPPSSVMGMAPPSGKPQVIAPSLPKPPGPATAAKPAPEKRRPMLIYRANVHLAVFEARKAIDEVETLAKKLGGYLVERSDDSIVVRVPAATFDSALESVGHVGDELHRQVQVQDVTAEFRDMQIRLKNLQAVRNRLAALLDRAKTVEEALRVERELERVAGDIESIKGKLKYFSELVAFSTISVNFQARQAETLRSEVELPFPWLDQLGLGSLLNLN